MLAYSDRQGPRFPHPPALPLAAESSHGGRAGAPAGEKGQARCPGDRHPAIDTRRRFARSLRYFAADYAPLADRWEAWRRSEPTSVRTEM